MYLTALSDLRKPSHSSSDSLIVTYIVLIIEASQSYISITSKASLSDDMPSTKNSNQTGIVAYKKEMEMILLPLRSSPFVGSTSFTYMRCRLISSRKETVQQGRSVIQSLLRHLCS